MRRLDSLVRRPRFWPRFPRPSSRGRRRSRAAPSRRPTGPPSGCSSCSSALPLASPIGRPSRRNPPRSSIRPAAASPASRTASPSPATICPPPRSSAFPASSIFPAIDGLIYSVGFLVGWPIVTFLIAEPLRNLGKYTFADVASFRLGQSRIRILAACGSLVVVAFYLIAQMVGAGKLIQILFGLDYWMAVVIVGVLMIIYVTFGGMLATTWVQIIKAVLLLVRRDLHGAWRCFGSSASARRRCSPRRSRCIRSISPSWSPAPS